MAKGFRVSRDRMLTLAGCGFQEVWRFQSPRVSGKIGLRAHYEVEVSKGLTFSNTKVSRSKGCRISRPQDLRG